jgi:hypothetical protein
MNVPIPLQAAGIVFSQPPPVKQQAPNKLFAAQHSASSNSEVHVAPAINNDDGIPEHSASVN